MYIPWGPIHRDYTFLEVSLDPDEAGFLARNLTQRRWCTGHSQGGFWKEDWGNDMIWFTSWREIDVARVGTRTTGVGAISDRLARKFPGDVGGLDGGISSSSEGRKELLDSIQIWRWSRQNLLTDWTWSGRQRGSSGDTGLLIWGREQEGGVGLVEEVEGRRRWRGSAFNPS